MSNILSNTQIDLARLSASPHLRTDLTVAQIMRMVSLALVPAVIMGVYAYGWRALLVIIVSITSCIITEYLFDRSRNKTTRIKDGSAVLTGLLLALCLPPQISLSAVVIGAVFSISIGKMIFGGLGMNIFNPALLGRAFLAAAFPVWMTTWTKPMAWLHTELVTSATPLAVMKFEGKGVALADLLNLHSGCIGEASVLAVLAGGVFLILMRLIDWRTPVAYLSSLFLISAILWHINPVVFQPPWIQLLSGGLMLGAFFMATDYVTTPMTGKGKIIFGIGAGIVLAIVRFKGGLPEGVMYSILLMNSLVPLIDRYTANVPFGKEPNRNRL